MDQQSIPEAIVTGLLFTALAATAYLLIKKHGGRGESVLVVWVGGIVWHVIYTCVCSRG